MPLFLTFRIPIKTKFLQVVLVADCGSIKTLTTPPKFLGPKSMVFRATLPLLLLYKIKMNTICCLLGLENRTQQAMLLATESIVLLMVDSIGPWFLEREPALRQPVHLPQGHPRLQLFGLMEIFM